jgi:hypothetical protein
MNLPNITLKDAIAKLSLLKNHMGLLVPICIAVVGLLMIVPARILAARLRTTIEKTSLTDARAIDGLVNELSPEKFKVTQAYVDAAAQDANDLVMMMDQMAKRDLLSYSLFPDNNDPSQGLFDHFRRRYTESLASLLKSIRASDGTTATEILDALSSTNRSPEGAGRTGGPQGGNTALSWDMMTESQRRMIDDICLHRASNVGMYASLGDVGGHGYWTNWTFETRDSAYRDCWYWQLGYWAVEDVVATIRQMNGSAENALVAPVKRLMYVGFNFRRPTAGSAKTAKAGTARNEADRPAYITSPYRVLTTPCTSRICSDKSDIIHFDVQVVVDATQVMPFIRALCSAKEHLYHGPRGDEPEQKYRHNQITVLEIAVKPIEARDNNHALYRYGDRQVAELELICEYAFDRTPTYVGLVPAPAKEDLGVKK